MLTIKFVLKAFTPHFDKSITRHTCPPLEISWQFGKHCLDAED